MLSLSMAYDWLPQWQRPTLALRAPPSVAEARPRRQAEVETPCLAQEMDLKVCRTN